MKSVSILPLLLSGGYALAEPVNPELKHYIDGASDTFWFGMLALVNDERCTNATLEAEAWFEYQVQEIDEETLFWLDSNHVLYMAAVYKYFIDKKDSGQYFGANGEYTEEMNAMHSSNEAFWSSDVDVDDTLLLGMHGADLKDNRKLIPTLQLMFPHQTQEDRNEFANEIQKAIESLPGGFDNPILTFNAFALKGFDVLGTGTIFPNSIMIGDGLLEFVQDLNLSGDGPDSLMLLSVDITCSLRQILHAGIIADPSLDPDASYAEVVADGFDHTNIRTHQ